MDLTLTPDAVWSALLDWSDESHPRQRGLTALQTAYNTWCRDNGDFKKKYVLCVVSQCPRHTLWVKGFLKALPGEDTQRWCGTIRLSFTEGA